MSARRAARPTILLAAGLLALATAACGTSFPLASPSPSPSPTPNIHGVPALESRLPDTIGGTALSKLSLTGAEFLATGTDTNRSQVMSMLGALSATPQDLAVATAHDPNGQLSFEEGIFQVKGAPPDRLLQQWVASQQEAMHGSLEVSNTTVAGLAVTKVVDASVSLGGTTYALAKGDAIYLIVADDQSLLTEALGKVP